MSLNPLNELKRHLSNTSTPLPKRLCLAKNMIQSHHFSSVPKERVIADWLEGLNENKILKSEELKNVLNWLNGYNDFSGELKYKLVQIVSQYVQMNPLQDSDIQTISTFIENEKIKPQLNLQIEEYLTITITLLQYLRSHETSTLLPQRIFNNFTKYYKESKKKLEFIVKLLSGQYIETIFSYLHTDCHNSVIDVCKNILFPINKRTYFISFLQTLIRKDNLDELIAEKGDNIQSVLKIMDVFFEFPKGRTDCSVDFLKDFIEVFVSCFRTESQIVYAFYIMVANFFNLYQNYIKPAMSLTTVNFGSENVNKTQRLLFLNMLEILLHNEVDINVRLTDTFGEKIPKVEIKKTFILFLQAVMLNQLKLEGKPDKTTIEIIKVALKLDPSLIEQKIDQILPPLMSVKKNSTNVLESYTEMLNCLLETLFKLSRGTLFVNQILPNVKLSLEASNTEQFELKQKLYEENVEKIESKIITGIDIFPKECVEMYGKLTSELMFRQNRDLLVSLHKDFELHCLMMLEEGFVSPSIITIAEVLSAILSSFFRHSKMADHTVALQVAEEFWNVFKKFEEECLRKFGECILKLSYNPPLVISFLNLCLSFSQLKLLNIKYSTVKLDISQVVCTSEVYDLSTILPCLNSEQWMELVSKIKEDEAVILLDNLLIIKTTITKLVTLKNSDVNTSTTKSHLIKQLTSNPGILQNSYFAKTLLSDLERKQYKELAKVLTKIVLNNPEVGVLKNEVVKNNRLLQNFLVLESAKNISKLFDNCDVLTKGLNKLDFNVASFSKENNMRAIFEIITLKTDIQEDTIKTYIDILKELQVPYLEENYQLVVIFLLLAIKKCCKSKKERRNINTILQITYELSLQPPDLYQLFCTDYVFEFNDKVVLDLLTLKSKNRNNMLIVRNLIESAVKRVKVDSDLVKSIVEILLKTKVQNKTGLEVFNDPIFQISCIILPLIVKQKKAITASVHRSILADLQEKLQKELLESFKNIDFTQIGDFKDAGNSNESLVDYDSMATLNAMSAYSLTLSKFCETTDVEETKNLNHLWSGLRFFMQNAINAIKTSTKQEHMESSIQLLNITLRHIKKLEKHEIFKEKDKLFNQIWQSLQSRLVLVLEDGKGFNSCILDDIAMTLKFLCELSSVECFSTYFVGDLAALSVLKKPSQILKDETKSDITSHKVAKYLLTQCLKANIVGPKCVALSKLTYKIGRNLRFWIRQHYDVDSDANRKKIKINIYSEEGNENGKKIVKVEDEICELLRINLNALSEIILAAKKISLDYKYLDSIFEMQHLYHHIMGSTSSQVKCEISWQAYFNIYEGCIAVLNSLIVSREEILEDRWPCYMQCYRALVTSLCERANSQEQLERSIEDKLAEIAHSVEKLTQSISKRKKHVARISAYTVADICTLLEKAPPTRSVRQHLENATSLLMQACDSTHAMAFLKRSLAGSAGQVTVANMYLNYKRYHKYVGNA